jgi:hypothetical protein
VIRPDATDKRLFDQSLVLDLDHEAIAVAPDAAGTRVAARG